MTDSRAGKPTPAVENYLAAIYIMERDGETVIGRKLADWLGVSAPTVTITVKRMIESGWVEMAADKTISLTQAGREAAISVIRRHMLVELLLARILGVPWSQVHEEADRIEHSLSAETAARVARVVDYPDVCPHGNPIPGHEEATADLTPLLQAKLGVEYTLARVHEEAERNSELMAFLERHHLVPGTRIRLLELMPVNETVTVESAGNEVVLGLSVARCLWVSSAEKRAA
ncbi:MAG: metal-dependent transcriptional regulator [Chloroflexi bacterium]|nr:metal-dependent transcriptional regulator [Chloroflexota bacterium]